VTKILVTPFMSPPSMQLPPIAAEVIQAVILEIGNCVVDQGQPFRLLAGGTRGEVVVGLPQAQLAHPRLDFEYQRTARVLGMVESFGGNLKGELLQPGSLILIFSPLHLLRYTGWAVFRRQRLRCYYSAAIWLFFCSFCMTQLVVRTAFESSRSMIQLQRQHVRTIESVTPPPRPRELALSLITV
jgi:hypothetical protein